MKNVLIWFCLLLLPAGVAAQGTFELPRVLPPGGAEVLPVDLDGDGVDEIVIATGTNEGILILYADGQTVVVPINDKRPVEIAAGDLDGDGDLDLATTISNSTECMYLIENLGDRDFHPRQTYLWHNHGDIALTDLSGDGLPDLVLAGLDTDVYWNNGSWGFVHGGSWQPEEPPNSAVFAGALTVADMNDDGRDDVVIVLTGFEPMVSVCWTVVLWNRDRPTPDFQMIAVGGGETEGELEPLQVVVANFDGNAKMDIAVAIPGVVKILGGYTWNWTERASIEIPGSNGVLAVVDLEGDGGKDLLVGGVGAGLWTVPHLGGFSFSAPIPRPQPAEVFDLSPGVRDDLGHEGSLYLLRAHDAADTNRLVVMPCVDGAVRVGWPSPVEIIPEMGVAHAWGDFDRDGLNDLATAFDDHLYLRRGLGEGRFELVSALALAGLPSDLCAADLDLDSDLDLCALSMEGHSLWMIENRGDWQFQSAETIDLQGSARRIDSAPSWEDPRRLILPGDGVWAIGLQIMGGWEFVKSVSALYQTDPVFSAFGEADGDEGAEWIAGDPERRKVAVYDVAEDASLVLRDDWTLPAAPSWVAAGDLTGLGAVRVLAHSVEDDRLRVYRCDGSLDLERELPPGASEMLLAKLDGSGRAEILAFSPSAGRFWALAAPPREPLDLSVQDYDVDPFTPIFFDAVDLTGSSWLDLALLEVADIPRLRVAECLAPPNSSSAPESAGLLAPPRASIAYPNPSRGVVHLLREPGIDGTILLSVHDAQGRLVDRTVSAEIVPRWSGRDRAGRLVAPGVYIVTMESAMRRASAKIVLRD